MANGTLVSLPPDSKPDELIMNPIKSQVRYDISNATFDDFTTDQKSSAWVASAADTFTLPIAAYTRWSYLTIYVGFYTGLSYFSPGLYVNSTFYGDVNFPTANTASCTVDPIV